VRRQDSACACAFWDFGVIHSWSGTYPAALTPAEIATRCASAILKADAQPDVLYDSRVGDGAMRGPLGVSCQSGPVRPRFDLLDGSRS
jgi:hypothetical protein